MTNTINNPYYRQRGQMTRALDSPNGGTIFGTDLDRILAQGWTQVERRPSGSAGRWKVFATLARVHGELCLPHGYEYRLAFTHSTEKVTPRKKAAPSGGTITHGDLTVPADAAGIEAIRKSVTKDWLDSTGTSNESNHVHVDVDLNAAASAGNGKDTNMATTTSRLRETADIESGVYTCPLCGQVHSRDSKRTVMGRKPKQVPAIQATKAGLQLTCTACGNEAIIVERPNTKKAKADAAPTADLAPIDYALTSMATAPALQTGILDPKTGKPPRWGVHLKNGQLAPRSFCRAAWDVSRSGFWKILLRSTLATGIFVAGHLKGDEAGSAFFEFLTGLWTMVG